MRAYSYSLYGRYVTYVVKSPSVLTFSEKFINCTVSYEHKTGEVKYNQGVKLVTLRNAHQGIKEQRVRAFLLYSFIF